MPLDSTLGDQALARLLKRVDAKNHMVSLSLVGCWRVTGAGLYPLEGSTVLRSIDFRRATLARGTLRYQPLSPWALEFLTAMIPRLESLHISAVDGISPFQARAQAKSQKDQPFFVLPHESRTSCATCRELVPAMSSVQKQTGHCSNCFSRFCTTCTPIYFRECASCNRACCKFCLDFEGESIGYICTNCQEPEYEEYNSV